MNLNSKSFYLADFRGIYKGNLFGFEVVRPYKAKSGRLLGLELVRCGHLHRHVKNQKIPLIEINDSLFNSNLIGSNFDEIVNYSYV